MRITGMRGKNFFNDGGVIVKNLLTMMVVCLTFAVTAKAEFVMYDDFNEATVDTAKWELTGNTPLPYTASGELRTEVANSANGKEYVMPLPQNVGEKLTVEVCWRKWSTDYFTQQTMSVNAVTDPANPTDRTWMGAVNTNTTIGYYSYKNADNSAWTATTFKSLRYSNQAPVIIITIISGLFTRL